MSTKSTLKLKDYLSDEGKLDLSILNLKAVPNVNEILALRKVKSIDLSNNQIESLPDDFIKLDSIHTLDLSKNRLTTLPDNFGQLKSLKQLDLFDNRITHLPISFCELTKLEYLDLKNNPLEEDLQLQAGKCLNKKECRTCAQRVLQYTEQLKGEFEMEEAIKLKKKQANEKAKVKKREKQVEKEREDKRLKRLENAQKRLTEKERLEQGTNANPDESNEDDEPMQSDGSTAEASDGWVSQIIDGTLNGVLLSLMMFFTWQMYLNRRQPLNFRDFYKYI